MQHLGVKKLKIIPAPFEPMTSIAFHNQLHLTSFVPVLWEHLFKQREDLTSISALFKKLHSYHEFSNRQKREQNDAVVRVHGRHRWTVEHFAKSFVLQLGYVGIVAPIPRPPNMQNVYPLSEFREFMPPNEGGYAEFIRRNRHVVLISFGSSYSPPKEVVVALKRTVRRMYAVGFIWSTRSDKNGISANFSLPHVYMDEKVPQKQLLSSRKTRLIVGHCGFYGILEAVYTGT